MENLLQAVADKLTSLGWRATGDAQWTNLEKAIPELVALLRPPSPTVGGGGKLKEVVDFLCGEASLNGLWYGEVPMGGRAFWWRKILREAVAEPPAAPLVRADAAPTTQEPVQEGLEPDGGNVYKPHPLMIHSGKFWRCAHGLTGYADGLGWVGCPDCIDTKAAAAWPPEVVAVIERHTKAFRDTSDEVWDRNPVCAECNHAWPCDAGRLAAFLRSTPSAPPAAWKGMETAPRDGTLFIGFYEHPASIWKMEICWWGWGPGALANKIWMGENGPVEPTHWQPLPKPPKGVEE